MTSASEFIQQLNTLRKTREVTIGELALATRIDRANLSRILSGKTNPTFDTILKITKALDAHVTIQSKPTHNRRNR